jgi:Domain of unknown function (DUF4412)
MPPNMKRLELLKVWSSRVVALVALLTAGPLLGQIPGPSPADINAALSKLFGSTKAFSSKADVRMLDHAQKESMSTTMNFSLRDGNMRLELDLTQIKSKEMRPEDIASLKQMGMDKMISIIRPDKTNTLMICPSLRAYAEMPMSKEDAADLNKDLHVQKTRLGRETIDGHPCDKNKVIVTDEKGARHEAIVWNATDLKDFPIKMQINQKDATVVMHYKEIQLTKPDARQFEPPAGYTKHDSMEKLMQVAVMKMLSGGK